ncbi:MAG: DUF3455 domain-containing protein [Methylococcaceae bacterium]
MFKQLIRLAVFLPIVASAEVSIPEAIRAPSGHEAFLSVHAKGDQIYQCSVNNDKYSWQIQAPDAKLFDDQGQIVGKHYSGPIWEYKEGSRVEGRITQRLNVAPESSISWLLVEVVGHKGDSMFAKTSFINRINTQGGLAPTTGCDANHLGSEKRVNYSADYIFYRKV